MRRSLAFASSIRTDIFSADIYGTSSSNIRKGNITAPCHNIPPLTVTTGRILWSLYPPPTIRPPRRLRHKILRRWLNQLSPSPTKRPIQRHPNKCTSTLAPTMKTPLTSSSYLPARRLNHKHNLHIPPNSPLPLRSRQTLDRHPNPNRQRHLGRRKPIPPQTPHLHRL